MAPLAALALLPVWAFMYARAVTTQAEEAAEKGLARNPAPEQAPFGHYILADIYSRRQEPEKMNEALKKANAYKSNRSIR